MRDMDTSNHLHGTGPDLQGRSQGDPVPTGPRGHHDLGSLPQYKKNHTDCGG